MAGTTKSVTTRKKTKAEIAWEAEAVARYAERMAEPGSVDIADGHGTPARARELYAIENLTAAERAGDERTTKEAGLRLGRARREIRAAVLEAQKRPRTKKTSVAPRNTAPPESIPTVPRKRGRPPAGERPQTQAERSEQARARRAEERARRTRAMAAALDAWTTDVSDPAVHDLTDAAARWLLSMCVDVHQAPGETDADAGIRAAVRALHAAVAHALDGDGLAAAGAMREALDEVTAG